MAIDYNGIRSNKYTSWPNRTIRINGHEYIIQCPSKIDENTTFYVAGRGAGGIGDTRSTFNAANGKNVIVIAPVHQDDGSFPDSVDVIEALASEFHIEPRATFSGHSNSGTLALRTAIKYIKKYNTPTTIVLNDPSVYLNPDNGVDYGALKGSLILNYAPYSGGCTEQYMYRLQKAAAAGATVILCRYNGDHGGSDDVAASMGAYDISNMRLLDRGKYVQGSYTFDSKYTYQYIDNKGKIHTFNNAEEAQKYMDSALAEITGTLYEKCETLKEFSERYNGATGTLASNLVFVNNEMEALINQTTAHNDINYTKGSDNEAGVVGAMYSATNYYGTVTNTLYSNLTAEANAVSAIASAIYKMDGFASLIAETSLTDGVKSLYSDPALSTEVENLKKATGDLFDNALNAVKASGRYDELSNILGSPVAEGKVGNISIASLERAINAIVPSLNEEVSKAMGLKAGVDEFMSGIGASGILQGGVWDDVKTNMESYQNLLDCNAKAANFISDTLKTAMGVIVNYMGEDTELDDSKLPELEIQFDDLVTKIGEMQQELTKMKSCRIPGESHDYTDPETGKITSYTDPDKPCYTDTALTEYSNQIDAIELQKTELKEFIDKLKGLAPIVEAAQKMINDAINQVKAMYENPVTDTNGNQSFVADFKLDLSAYGLDSDTDYKKLVDDYYEKLNPTSKGDDGTEPQTDEWPGDNGNPAGAGPGPDGKTEAPTEKPTEAKTESSTEKPTSTKTEVPTEANTETQTEATTEVNSETQTEIITETQTIPEKTRPNHHTYRNNKDIEEEVIINTTPPEIVEEEVENPYYEEEIKMPKPEIINISSDVNKESEDTSFKTMGIASGIGVALGAAALGAHAMMKNKDKEEEEEDMGYEK